MTWILYTNAKGGDWLPFKTPLSEDCIFKNLWTDKDNGGIDMEKGVYVPSPPGTKLLPEFYSVLLSNGSRWDTDSQEWTKYQPSGQFDRLWSIYVLYSPSERPADLFWKDQGPGLLVIEDDWLIQDNCIPKDYGNG